VVRDEMPAGLLGRSIRYSIDQHRLRAELRALETTDDITGLPNLRGFVPVAEHHLRMADRDREPVVLVFVRLDDLDMLEETRGHDEANELVAEAAEVVMTAIRDADYPARISRDTFCVLLTGQAAGAEVTVLSRLVEAIAVRNAGRSPRLALSVGSALYDPDRPATLDEILGEANRRMRARVSPPERSEDL
jgi:diguanylate cyclase (GGDEF)-like protein